MTSIIDRQFSMRCGIPKRYGSAKARCGDTACPSLLYVYWTLFHLCEADPYCSGNRLDVAVVQPRENESETSPVSNVTPDSL